MMTRNYSFACPHCGAVAAVDEEKNGGVVPCAACARPYRAQIPAGTLQGAPLAAPLAAGPAVARPLPVQAAELRLHPAIWRLRWGTTCFHGVLVLGSVLISLWALWRCQPGAWCWFFLVGSAALWLVGSFNLVQLWLKACGETLEVTPAATRWSLGLFKRRSVEIRHDAVRAVEVEQTFFQRLLGIGTLTLSSNGSDDDEIVMRGVPDVKRVAAVIRGHMGR